MLKPHETALLSEPALAEDWDRPEEEEAWQRLQRERNVQHVSVDDETLTAELSDGRIISVPLPWYPRLVQGTPEERRNWRLIGHREGIHWPDLDEDISAENIIRGKPSGESQRSLQRWMEERLGQARRD